MAANERELFGLMQRKFALIFLLCSVQVRDNSMLFLKETPRAATHHE